MLLELIFLIVIACLSLWIVKLKAEIKHIYKYASRDAKRSNSKDEFSLETGGINNDFTGKILLDSLTNLPAREAFEDRLTQAIHQSGRSDRTFAIMLFDIDDFKTINDKYGYETGDKVIIEVSKRLQKVIRQIDTLTRFAGQKFIILLPQLVSPETAAYVAQRTLDCVLTPFVIEDKQIMLTGSVGVAIYPDDGHDAQTLLKNANDALSQAKKLGKGNYKFYREEMHALGQRELSIHAVFSADDFLNYLTINYQPQINTATGEVVAIQASPVLHIPEHGDIAFVDFARIAENCKKAIDIWEWLIRNAATQFQQWRNDELNLKNLIIDVTYNQIQDPQFIFRITQILQEFKLDPKEIIFEVVERNLSKNSDSIEKSFVLLAGINIQIGLSLFALGRLAIHKITKLPVTYLKIDAHLIKEKQDLNEYEPILQTLVSLAAEMQINIVAEGVESQYQKQLLESFGCIIMQGKLFSAELPGA